MNGQTEFGLDRPGERPGARWASAGDLRLDERHHLGRELVGALRAARPRQQPGQPEVCERRFGLVEGGSREAKEGRGIGLRRTLVADLAEHLVLHLDQVARIEEAIGLEPRCPDPLRMPVHGILLLEALGFGIALGQGGGLGGSNVNIYTPLSCRRQDLFFDIARYYCKRLGDYCADTRRLSFRYRRLLHYISGVICLTRSWGRPLADFGEQHAQLHQIIRPEP